MKKGLLKRFLLLALWAGAARAQGLQNTDIAVLFGTVWNTSNAIPGTNLTLASSSLFTAQDDFGYQVVRASAASLWVDASVIWGTAGTLTANVPGSGSTKWTAGTAGVRFMVPVNSRLSFYAVTGAGGGNFRAVAVVGGSNPSISTYSTDHGVFAFGGGADVRIWRWLSLRADIRDWVTGRELSGTAGRQHLVPSVGFGFHF